VLVTSNPHPHSHSHPHSHESKGKGKQAAIPEFEKLQLFLEAHFGNVSGPESSDDDDLLTLEVKVDDQVARLDLISMVSAAPGRQDSN
jgi:cleavage and polyadenylation specificity factor subunit 3